MSKKRYRPEEIIAKLWETDDRMEGEAGRRPCCHISANLRGGDGINRKPRANNRLFRALRGHPKDAVDTGNPLHYDDFPSDAPLA